MKTLLSRMASAIAFVFAVGLLWYGSQIISYLRSDTPEVSLEKAKVQCLVALVAKSALGEEEMVWALKAYDNRVSVDKKVSPCDLFSSYELNRSPSQKPQAKAIRNADIIVEVEGRAWHKERVRKAKVLVDAYMKGDRKMFDTRKYPDMLCVSKFLNYVGPFWVDWGGSDRLMNKEMRLVHTAPGGAKPHFFCPK